MTQTLKLAFAASCIAGALPATAATHIDFEAGGPCLYEDTTPLTTAYSGLGVTFSGVGGQSGAIVNECANFGIPPRSGTDFLGFNTNVGTAPVGRLEFANLVSFVSIYVGYRSSQFYSATAYDQQGLLIGSTSVRPGASEWGLLSITVPGIKSFRFGGQRVFVADDLSFGSSGAVPEPATWAMLIAGFGLVGAAARRRRPLAG